MALLYVISFSSDENLPAAVDAKALQTELSGLLRKKFQRPVVYSASAPLCMHFGAGLSQAFEAPLWVCTGLEDSAPAISHLQESYVPLEVKPDYESRSFYGLAQRFIEAGQPCIFFASQEVINKINSKDLIHKKTIKDAVNICEFSCKNIPSRMIETDPGISEAMTQRRAMVQSLRRSFVQVSTLSQSTQNLHLAKQLEHQAKEVTLRSQGLTQVGPADARLLQPRIDSLKTLVQRASTLYHSVNEKLQELSERADSYLQEDWNGRDYLEIQEFKVSDEDNTWEIKLKNQTDSTFVDVHCFVWESRTPVCSFHIIEPKTTVVFRSSLPYTPELYTQHLLAQSQGKQASKPFPISPVKIVSVTYRSGTRVDIGLLNLAREPQAGLVLTSPEFVSSLEVGQALRYDTQCVVQFEFPKLIENIEQLELFILQNKQVVSRPFLWKVPPLTPDELPSPKLPSTTNTPAITPPLPLISGKPNVPPQQPSGGPQRPGLPNIGAQSKPPAGLPVTPAESSLPSLGGDPRPLNTRIGAQKPTPDLGAPNPSPHPPLQLKGPTVPPGPPLLAGGTSPFGQGPAQPPVPNPGVAGTKASPMLPNIGGQGLSSKESVEELPSLGSEIKGNAPNPPLLGNQAQKNPPNIQGGTQNFGVPLIQPLQIAAPPQLPNPTGPPLNAPGNLGPSPFAPRGAPPGAGGLPDIQSSSSNASQNNSISSQQAKGPFAETRSSLGPLSGGTSPFGPSPLNPPPK